MTTVKTPGVYVEEISVKPPSVARVATTTVSDEMQANLNVDVLAGKTINAIRVFEGKGTLVWGARTLRGNDNEWRYIPVRRLMMMVVQSLKKATEHVVFEPNDANTWAKVKGLLETFLYYLWRDGAFQGETPERAFFVRVALGQTMTAQDVSEGRLIIEYGLAVVRPAEFLMGRISHVVSPG